MSAGADARAGGGADDAVAVAVAAAVAVAVAVAVAGTYRDDAAEMRRKQETNGSRLLMKMDAMETGFVNSRRAVKERACREAAMTAVQLAPE